MASACVAWSIIIEAMPAALWLSPCMACVETAGRDIAISNHASKAVTRKRREVAKRRRENSEVMYASLGSARL
ncbi:hypothetical protein GCM10010981_26760 [Dyella nitratireducens]|uniref:Secreted protein n=1 Tax=Dyella nitratireducens TaxID=1849580 RepID=A0ABQ1G5M0_9GAMM|nr:hypothetical protein GCM10010981_26760 [Dyella nitratireducens]GLQ40197.1 hypothetical protein GCM10007902_00460 [Dyella nitratireducens]